MVIRHPLGKAHALAEYPGGESLGMGIEVRVMEVFGLRGVWCGQATALNPFLSTSVSSFNEAPRGRFSPRSHWLTRPVVTFR